MKYRRRPSPALAERLGASSRVARVVVAAAVAVAVAAAADVPSALKADSLGSLAGPRPEGRGKQSRGAVPRPGVHFPAPAPPGETPEDPTPPLLQPIPLQTLVIDAVTSVLTSPLTTVLTPEPSQPPPFADRLSHPENDSRQTPTPTIDSRESRQVSPSDPLTTVLARNPHSYCIPPERSRTAIVPSTNPATVKPLITSLTTVQPPSNTLPSHKLL